ncbi:hypothetical protein Tco_0150951 [Tanacetum coccineum]
MVMPQQDDTGFIDSGCSRHMNGNITYLSDFKTPQQNGVDGRRNRILIEAARTMLADSKLPTNVSYFDSPSKDVGNGEPKSATDEQKQVEDGPHNESDKKDKSEDDSSPKEVNAAGQHVNNYHPELILLLSDSSWGGSNAGKNFCKSSSNMHVKRGQDTKIPQSSGPPVKVGDEAVHKELGDKIKRAATIASSLEAEQDSGNINRTQSMATLNEPKPTKLVGDLGSGEKGEKEISTANISVSTASATPEVSTAAENLVYIRRSAEKRKDKGKAFMKEDESV